MTEIIGSAHTKGLGDNLLYTASQIYELYIFKAIIFFDNILKILKVSFIMKSNKSLMRYLLILSLVLQALFLFYIKYKNQFLSLQNFNLYQIGNLLIILIYFILIIASYLLISKKRIKIIKLALIIFIGFLFLVISYFSNYIQLPFNKYYFFGQYGNKLFTGLCFTIFILSVFYYGFYLLYFNQSNSFLKSLLSSLIFMFLVLLFANFYILLNENKVKETSLDSKSKNILVVLGAAVWSDNKPSPILAARVEKAVELSKKFPVEKIYFTGSNAPGEMPESKVALNYFKELKKDFENIEIETKTSSTNEQIRFIKEEILLKHPDYQIIVLSDSFHLVRIKEISNFHNIKLRTIASDLTLSLSSNFYNRLRESLALVVFWFFSI
jgi:vancomycin permeability regulator SanA